MSAEEILTMWRCSVCGRLEKLSEGRHWAVGEDDYCSDADGNSPEWLPERYARVPDETTPTMEDAR